MIAVQPYRNLSVLLYVLAVLEALAGLLLLFGSGWALSMAPSNLSLPDTMLVMLFLKAIGVLALALGYLMCVTARDPARYVSIIDMMVFVLLGTAALLWYALAAQNIGHYFPANYVVIRIVIQVLLAIALIALRPKAARQSGA